MKAYLVDVSLRTRIILPEGFDVEEFWKTGNGVTRVVQAAEPKLIEKIRMDLGENIEAIEEDTEVPYDPEMDGDQFCETCAYYRSRVTEDEITHAFCTELQEPLGKTQWRGCPSHKKKIINGDK
jgi:hypothetical protein